MCVWGGGGSWSITEKLFNSTRHLLIMVMLLNNDKMYHYFNVLSMLLVSPSPFSAW